MGCGASKGGGAVSPEAMPQRGATITHAASDANAAALAGDGWASPPHDDIEERRLTARDSRKAIATAMSHKALPGTIFSDARTDSRKAIAAAMNNTAHPLASDSFRKAESSKVVRRGSSRREPLK